MEHQDISHSASSQNTSGTSDFAANLASLKRNLFAGAIKPIKAENGKAIHNHFNITQNIGKRASSLGVKTQTLKMCFTNQANERIVVTRTFFKPINALAAFKSAKTAEKTFGRLDSYALFSSPSVR